MPIATIDEQGVTLFIDDTTNNFIELTQLLTQNGK